MEKIMIKNIIKQIALLKNKHQTNIKLTASGGKGVLAYSDGEKCFISKGINTKIADGEYILPLKTAENFIKVNNFDFENGENGTYFLKCDKRKLNIQFTHDDLSSYPELPLIDDSTDVELNCNLGELLNRLLKTTANVSYNESYRGFYFGNEGEIVATNVHAVVVAKERTKHTGKQFVLAPEAVKVFKSNNVDKFAVVKTLDKLKVVNRVTSSVINTKEGVFVIKNLKNEFPKYKSVVSDVYPTHFKANKSSLLKELKIIENIIPPSIEENLIKVIIKPSELEVVGGKYTVEFDFDMIEPNILLGGVYNAILWKKMLSIFYSDSIEFNMVSDFCPLVMMDDEITCLVMPIRKKEY